MNRIARHLRNVARRKSAASLLFLLLLLLVSATLAIEDGKLGDEEDEDFGWNDEEPFNSPAETPDYGIPLVRKEEFTNNQLYAEAYQSYIQALACKFE
uniref:Uncharacterized protein n=1 Tax=Caenorhabditis japonica TaxID=281687 RepID=A0A8R1IM37_CAEJA